MTSTTSRPFGRGLRAAAHAVPLTAFLAACGGGGSSAPSAPPIPPAPPTTAAVATLASPASNEFPWRVAQASAVSLTDASGHAVATASVTCAAHDATQATVSVDCSHITTLRVGAVVIDVAGGGASASLTINGVPQRQWTGLHGADSANGGGSYDLMTMSDGSVLAWGANPAGVLSQAAGPSALTFLATPAFAKDGSGTANLADIMQVSAGDTSAAALTRSGGVLGWGTNDDRQLGSITVTSPSLVPVAAQDLTGHAALTHVAQVEFGAGNSVALIDDGSVLAWGTWTGNGTTSSSTLPAAVLQPDGSGPLTRVVAVSAGWSYSLALTDDGHVVAWGYDLNDGRLGSGAVLDTVQPLPNRVKRADGSDLDNIVQISAGYDFALALAADGTVWAWGDNESGQIGQNAPNGNRPVAMQVKGADGLAPLARIAMVAAGGNHALALDLDGRVLAWGDGGNGALGDGPNRPAGNQALLPRVVVSDTGAVTGFTNVVSIAAGFGSGQALRADGTVLSWGGNFRNALGRATTASSDPTPAPVVGMGGGALTLDVSAYPNLLRRAR